jgi:hypothetical protein
MIELNKDTEGSVFIKKIIIKLNFLKKQPKPSRNWFKPAGFGSV